MSTPASSASKPIAFSELGSRARPPAIARLMALAIENPSLLSLAAGFTDNQTLPVEAVGAIVAGLAGEPAAREALQYGTNQGRVGLRGLLSARFAIAEGIDDGAALTRACFVTNGSQQALYLAMQVLADPGDIVLVDRPSYFVYLEMLAGLGLEIRSIPYGDNGRPDLERFAALLASMRVRGELARLKAVYIVSYFSNPSGLSLSGADKDGIGSTLAAHGAVIPVIEDAAYRDLYFEEPAEAPSVWSLPSWRVFPKLYASTLTKPFATGLKVGYGLCSDAEWLARMLHMKGHHDFGTANFNQAVAERALGDGFFDRQLAAIRPGYAAKMRVLDDALVAGGLMIAGWRWKKPSGGLYLWLEAPPGLRTGLESDFCRACVAAGVLYVPGELCFGDDAPGHFVRLSFGVLAERDLAEAGRRFAEVARKFASGGT